MSVRAFDLVLAVERGKLHAAKKPVTIECLEYCANHLYVATHDSSIVHLTMNVNILPNGKVTFQSERLKQIFLPNKKPAVSLKCLSALSHLLVLSDNNLLTFNSTTLELVPGSTKLKGVLSFCVNENPISSGNPFEVEIAVATKKKQIQICTVSEERIQIDKEINLSDLPLSLGLDGTAAFVALPTLYVVVDLETQHIQQLFPYNSEVTTPVNKRISQEEYLLNGPNALGMFATSSGISTRPPLQWSDGIHSIAFQHPYILALDHEFVTIHSIIDYHQKQIIPFQGGQLLGDFDGTIIIASTKDVYVLMQVPVERQIQSLLADQRVEEALQLAKNSQEISANESKYHKMLLRIQQQAGFIALKQLHFNQAGEMFKQGCVDVRELISVYPMLLPSGVCYTRSLPLLHDIADINQLIRGNTEHLKQCKQFLISYLEDIRDRDVTCQHRPEIDTALLKLYCELDVPRLVALVTSNNSCNVKDSFDWLERFHRYHCLGLFHFKVGSVDKALDIWTRIEDGLLVDCMKPGMEWIVDTLAKTHDQKLVWKYSEWVMSKNEIIGVQMFTGRTATEHEATELKPDAIVQFLSKYPTARLVYMEHLVFELKSKKEEYHTHLVLLYLDRVTQLSIDTQTTKGVMDMAKSKLRNMLQYSDQYRVSMILEKIKETDMYAEMSILYGKKEEHDKALNILVYKLQDYGAAERYCVVNSDYKSSEYRRKLFETLLTVYLDPVEGDKLSLLDPALSLINSPESDFDIIKILHRIPDSWGVGVIAAFLLQSLRKSLHNSRMSALEQNLAKSDHLNTHIDHVNYKNIVTRLTENSVCDVCHRTFSDLVFVRFPNGVVTHTACGSNTSVCPVSGKIFKATTRTDPPS